MAESLFAGNNGLVVARAEPGGDFLGSGGDGGDRGGEEGQKQEEGQQDGDDGCYGL